jgi:hypothetical protein
MKQQINKLSFYQSFQYMMLKDFIASITIY